MESMYNVFFLNNIFIEQENNRIIAIIPIKGILMLKKEIIIFGSHKIEKINVR